MQISLSRVNYEKHLSTALLKDVVFTYNTFLVPLVLDPVLSVTAHTDRYILTFPKVTFLPFISCHNSGDFTYFN